jgi:ElaB/YqjD/DUF883 family membrane-anchored ribosome-binding protein
MNTNRNVSFGSGIGPSGSSGSEVESAMFRPEAVHAEPVTLPSHRSDVMHRLDDLKSRSLSKVHDVQRVVSDRTSVIKSNLQQSVTTAKSSARTGVHSGVSKIQSSMRTNPAKWAGIAAGSGFVLGMLGRLIHARNEHRRHMPQLVIVETSC